MKKIYLIVLLLFCLSGNEAMAQDERTEEKSQYIVEIDSQFIKATPYEITFENGKEIHHDENVEWYTDAQIYSFIPKMMDENGNIMVSQSLYPAIFLLSGGAFVQKDNQAELNPSNNSLHDNLKLAKKLANAGYVVKWINYGVETNAFHKLKILGLLINANCSFLNGSEAKARLEHASLKSFRDFRLKFQQEINNANNYIDPNNVFVAGISAGAILAIYSVFLDQNEIPTSIPYSNCDNDSQTPILTGANVISQGYPMPNIKGIIPMAGGSLYNNIFSNNTTNTNNVAVNFMHGTCDELLNQNQGRVSYKFTDDSSCPYTFYYNTNIVSLYPHVYSSKYLYNLLTLNHNKIGFGQVINGGHGVFGASLNPDNFCIGSWDFMQTKIQSPPYIPDMSLFINQRDIVFQNIHYFMESAMGKLGYPAWTNHAYSAFPDKPTPGCLSDDLSLITPPIITVDSVCGTVSATVSNPPAWATFSWTVSPNLQIVGSNTGSAISYKSLSTGSAWVRVSVGYGGGVNIPVTKNVLVPATCPTPCNGILYYDNQTVSINTNIVHCGHIHSQNVVVNSGVSLALDATGYVLIPSNFEVPIDATLNINP
ncbi:MAG: hypothetical protein LC105_01995 [Chitinophagales bacterium]|nr:hypothetical protein [Chitinophagales bacterium]